MSAVKSRIPPAAAAADSVARSPLCVSLGPRKCTWSSIIPGMRYLPAASITTVAESAAIDAADFRDALTLDQQVAVANGSFVDKSWIW